MRVLIAFLAIATAAVTLALLFRINTGYVLFVSPPYRVELSQNAFIVIAVLGVIAILLLAWRVRAPKSEAVEDAAMR